MEQLVGWGGTGTGHVSGWAAILRHGTTGGVGWGGTVTPPPPQVRSVPLLEADVARGNEAGKAGEGGEHGGKGVEGLLVKYIAKGGDLVQQLVHRLQIITF